MGCGSRRRVVITGMGAVTPLGNTVDEFWRSLKEGRSGVARMSLCDPSSYPTQIAAEVKGFDPATYIEPKEARRMSRFIQFAIGVTEMALQDANLTLDNSLRDNVGVILGTSVGSLSNIEKEARVLVERGGMKINPFFLPMMLPNMGAAQISRLFGLRGPNSTIVTACASSTHAIGEATETIRRGAADVILTGGSEASICEFGLASFCVLRALSTRNDDPPHASRPFDLQRDGLIPSEGAALLVLESLEHARRRGASILAEIIGYGSSSDAYHVVAPEPEGYGAALAMQRAMDDAGVQPAEVDYINAHATSTTLGDIAETLAIKRVFGERAYMVPISATKSMIGHAMGAGGALETVACVMTIREGIIHPTINYETPDPQCDLDCVPNQARAAKVDVALCNSFGFGGQNAVLVLRAYHE